METVDGFLDAPPTGPRRDLRGGPAYRAARAAARVRADGRARPGIAARGGAGRAGGALRLPPLDGAALRRVLRRASSRWPAVATARPAIGAEVAIGDGLIGTVARERRLLRVAGVDAGLRYGRAVRREVHSAGTGRPRRRDAATGARDAQSQLALPLAVRDGLVGVLAVESRRPAGVRRVARGLPRGDRQPGRARVETCSSGREAEERGPARATVPAPRRACPRGRRGRTQASCFYPSDDCVFVDGEYLVRNVPGILWQLLRASRRRAHRVHEPRAAARPALGLPAVATTSRAG